MSSVLTDMSRVQAARVLLHSFGLGDASGWPGFAAVTMEAGGAAGVLPVIPMSGLTGSALRVGSASEMPFGLGPVSDTFGRASHPLSRAVGIGAAVTCVGYLNLRRSGLSIGTRLGTEALQRSALGNAAVMLLDCYAPSALQWCLEVLNARRCSLEAEQIIALECQLQALLAENDVDLKDAGFSISIPSFSDLLEVLAKEKMIHPSLSLSRNGYFAASWSPSRDAKLTLVFRGEGHGEWVAVDLNLVNPAQGSGEFSLPSLDDIPQRFLKWMSVEG